MNVRRYVKSSSSLTISTISEIIEGKLHYLCSKINIPNVVLIVFQVDNIDNTIITNLEQVQQNTHFTPMFNFHALWKL